MPRYDPPFPVGVVRIVERCPTGKSVTGLRRPLSIPFRKNISALQKERSPLYSQTSHPTEGRCATSRNAGRDAVDAEGANDDGARRGRRSRVVLTPRRWRQVLEKRKLLRGDGGKRARSPGRARRKPLKPLRREGRVVSGEPVVTTLVWFVFSPHGAAGASCARLSLCPLQGAGDRNQAKLARTHAARSRRYVLPSLRGALATKQSNFRWRRHRLLRNDGGRLFDN